MLKLRKKIRESVHDVAFKTRLSDVAMVSVSVAMMAVFGGFVYMNSVFSQDIDLKDMQVNSLIAEVGDLKQERTDLYQEILKDRAEMDDIDALLITLEGQIGVLSGGDIDLDALSAEVSAVKDQLDAQKDVVNTVVAESQEILSQTYGLVSADETFDVLILGTHGALTDTIMVASVNPDTGTVSLISIPRDLYVDGRKINEHYNLYGAEQMKQAIYDIIGILPEKYVVVDLQAFVDIVDAMGGLDIYVEKEIYDNQYPDGNFGYKVFYMEAGQQHMDGETALMYARSRKTTSDFDRAKRQQDVITAVRDNVAGMGILEDASAAVTVFKSVMENLDTDIDLFEGLNYYSDFKDYEIETGNVLSTSNYLYSTYNVYGQYILLQNGGDFGEIKNYVSYLIKE